MIGFIADIEFVWGFETRIAGLSKSSPSFSYPPPSVILGAISEVIAKENLLGEKQGVRIISELSKKLIAIGLKPINCYPVKYQDIGRIITIKITKQELKPDPKDLKGSFDAPSRGKTILSTFDDEPPKIRLGIVFKDAEINLERKKVIIDQNAIWQIHRLGSKESRVCVEKVKTYNNIKISEDIIVKTHFSFPILPGLSLVNGDEGWFEELYINPFQIEPYDEKNNPPSYYTQGKNILRFKLPLLNKRTHPTYTVHVKQGTAVYTLDENTNLIGLKK